MTLHDPIHNRPPLVDGTPWEQYRVDGVRVAVKREDLCCSHPGPPFSKVRGLYKYLEDVAWDHPDGLPPIGILDTFHSMAGWGVAYFCHLFGAPCHVFYPLYKGELGSGEMRQFQQNAACLGAAVIPLKAGMGGVLYHQAKKMFMDMTHDTGIFLPSGLKLRDAIKATSDETIKYTPEDFHGGTWVISISSGTIAAGILHAFRRLQIEPDVVLHMGYDRSNDAVLAYLADMAGYEYPKIQLVNEGYAYADAVDNSWIPFPCNAYYDAKAFTWLADNVRKLKQPIVFWNIGA